jgi:hypothetical protein
LPAGGLFFVKISYYEIILYYAPIARQFKVDSAGSGKVSALSRANAARAEKRKIGAMSDHAA